MTVTKIFKSLSLTAVCMVSLGVMSQANALDIRQSQIDGCKSEVTTFKIADAATADKLCTCSIDIRAKMTLGQMWEIESYARSGKDPTTLPFASKMQQDLKQCAVGLTLSPPQKPPQP